MNRADPNDTLVNHLTNLGYTPAQISSAQEKLWNSVGSGEGGYDDVAAVEGLLRQLHGGEEEEDSSEYETDTDSEEEEEEGLKGGSDQTAATAILSNGATTSTVSGPSNGAKMNPPQSRLADRPIAFKLNSVASDVSNLPDAIFALNEWTVKSASRGKVEKYLLEMKTDDSTDNESNGQGPLRIIIQRALLHSNNPKQDQTIVAGCANWITSILLGPACNLNATAKNNNNKMAHSTTMKKAVGELLRRGKACVAQLTSMDSDEEQQTQEFANTVSASILKLLQHAALEKQRYEKPSGTLSSGSNGDLHKQYSIAFSTQSQAQTLVKQAEADIAALTTKLAIRKQQISVRPANPASRRKLKNNVSAAANSAVVDLMSRRDRSKLIADKSGNIVEISVDCKKKFADEEAVVKDEEQAKEEADIDLEDSKAQQNVISGQYQSNEEKAALMLKCLGSSLQLTVDTSVAEVTALEGKIEEIVNQSSSEKEELTSRQSTIVSKRHEISSRMEQIRRELEDLARQDDQLATEENEVASELERLVRNSEKEIGGFKSKVEGKASYVTLDKELRRAVDKLSELEMAWIRSTSAATSSAQPALDGEPVPLPAAVEDTASNSQNKQPETPLPSLLPNKLTDYLHRARSYFQSEAAIVEFLRNRVSSAEVEVLDLEREIEAFSNLGMKNNVENMKNRLVMLKSHVDEDNIVIDSLRRDAKEMREDLIRRVEEYYEVMKSNVQENGADNHDEPSEPKILSATQIAALEGISIDLTGIGFYDDQDGGLGAIFSKIPKQISRMASPANTNLSGSEIDCDSSMTFIGDIDILPEAKANLAVTENKQLAPAIAPVQKMPKFSWASMATSQPKKETKSLLEIQKEEMEAAKGKNGSS